MQIRYGSQPHLFVIFLVLLLNTLYSILQLSEMTDGNGTFVVYLACVIK